MTKLYGYHGKILHINLTDKSSRVEVPGEIWYRTYAGGGLLGAFFLMRDTQQDLDAFDPQNRLIFASSVIAGQDGPGLARFSVVCQSPLSGGIAETRCEGPFGRWLKGCGYDALVIYGEAAEPLCLKLEESSVSFLPAEGLWGQDTYVTTTELTRSHGGQDVQIAAIGQAGENRVRFASIVTAGSVQAARMGVGAVMGAKKLKALILKGCHLPPVADPERLSGISQSFAKRMPGNVLSMWQKNPPGFSAAADLSDIDTAYIGMNNYKTNLSVGTSNYMRQKYLPYYQGFITCPGCPNDCIKIINPGQDHPESAGIHQEVTGALGPNIGNDDLKRMLEGNVLCNRFGLDPVSLGFTISFALECQEAGIIPLDLMADHPIMFGQTENLPSLIESIALRRGIGDLLAEGSRLAAERLGPAARPMALHVKGIEMVSFEPRTQTSLALGYATAPIGPRYDICEHDWDFDTVTGWDHTLELSRTLGIFERVPMEEISDIKVRHYKVLNAIWSACDALDLCVFASAPTRLLTMADMVALVESITGWKSSDYELMRWGDRRNHLMRLYNLRQGLDASQDTLPDRFFSDPIAYGRLSGTVLNRQAFQKAITLYYDMMGWDENGIPRHSTLIDYSLDWAAPAGKGG